MSNHAIAALMLVVGCGTVCAMPAKRAINSPALTLPSEVQQLEQSALHWLRVKRLDLARQNLEKLLAVQPAHLQAWLMLGVIEHAEGQVAQAAQILERLQQTPRAESEVRLLIEIAKLYQPETRKKIERMRLLHKAGRNEDATQLAQEIFPNGPDIYSGYDLEYFQLMSYAAKVHQSHFDREIEARWRKTRDPSLKILLLERQLIHGSPNSSFFNGIEKAARSYPEYSEKIKDVWRWGIQKLSWEKTPAQALKFLQIYSSDISMKMHLENAKIEIEKQRRINNLPINVAKRKFYKALEIVDLKEAELQLNRIEKLGDNISEKYALSGMFEAKRNNFDLAATYFEKAYAISGDKKWQDARDDVIFWKHISLTENLLDELKFFPAIDVVKRALSINSDNTYGLRLYASALHGAGFFEDAKIIYKQLLDANSKNFQAMRALFDLYLKNSDYSKVKEIFDKYLRITERSDIYNELSSAEKAEWFHIKADMAYALHDVATYISSMEAAIKEEPFNAWRRYQLSKFLVENLNDKEKSFQLIRDGLSVAQDSDEMKKAAALFFSSQKKWKEVLDVLGNGAKTERWDSVVKEIYFEALLTSILSENLAKRRPGENKNILKALYEVDKYQSDSEILGIFAKVFSRLNYESEAIVTYEKIKKNKILNFDQHLDYIQMLLVKNELLKIKNIFDDKALVKALMRNAATQSKFLELSRDYILASISSGVDASQVDEHLNLFIDENLSNPYYYLLLGDVYFAKNKIILSSEAFEKGIARYPDDLKLQYQFARNILAAGDAKRAVQSLKSLLVRMQDLQRWEVEGVLSILIEAKSWGTAEEVLSSYEKRPDVSAIAFDFQKAKILTARGDLDKAVNLYKKWSLADVDTASDAEIASDMQARWRDLEGRRQIWMETGIVMLDKPGESGISRVKGKEIPTSFWIPLSYESQAFVHVDRLEISAGPLKPLQSNNINSAFASQKDEVLYGQTAAVLAANSPMLGLNSSSGAAQRGFNVGLGFRKKSLEWDIGVIGLGMPIRNWVGGVAYQVIDKTAYTMSIGASRRPVKASVLSYIGAYDPGSGQKWGGVTSNSVAFKFQYRIKDWRFYSGVAFAKISGHNVKSNRSMKWDVALGNNWIESKNSYFYGGVDVGYLTYQQDHSAYSWGYGGYYSPKKRISLSIPLEWASRAGDLSWRLEGGPSISYSSPTKSSLYALPSSHFSSLPNFLKEYQHASNGGLSHGWSARTMLEYRFNETFTLGAVISASQYQGYTPNSLNIYARWNFSKHKVENFKFPSGASIYSDL